MDTNAKHKTQYARYYGYRPYWRGRSLWGVAELPGALYEDAVRDADALTEPEGDPHLVPMTQERIKRAPDYDPHAAVNRVYESRLYDYYGRPQYC